MNYTALYESGKITWDRERGAMFFEFPWTTVKVFLPSLVDSDAECIVNALTGRDVHSQCDFLPEILDEVRKFPVVYSQPRVSLCNRPPEYFRLAGIDLAGPRQFAATMPGGASDDKSVEVLPTCWSWDASAIVERSRVPGCETCDPITALGLLREQMLLYAARSTAEQQLAEVLDKSIVDDPALFKKVIVELLGQAHFITSHSSQLLEKSLQIPSRAARHLEKYINSERGHEQFVQESLQELEGWPLGDNATHRETLLSTSTLRLASETSILAVASCIGAFEWATYLDEDPLVMLLRKSEWPRSADGIARHFVVNKLGEHANVPELFVSCLGAVCECDVLTTTRMLEFIGIVRHIHAARLAAVS